jgi:hypothetical protein
MKRVYVTKGPDRLSRALNVPMRERDVEDLGRVAGALNLTRAELARQYILDGLAAVPKEGTAT